MLRGGDCLVASKFLEESLGDAVTEQKTAEFYQQAEAPLHVEQ